MIGVTRCRGDDSNPGNLWQILAILAICSHGPYHEFAPAQTRFRSQVRETRRWKIVIEKGKSLQREIGSSAHRDYPSRFDNQIHPAFKQLPIRAARFGDEESAVYRDPTKEQIPHFARK
jgi:hypothetical protein